jgi:Fe-S cluster assembly scaffold protein SufB
MIALDKQLLETIADLHEIPEGAYNIRKDGKSVGRNSTANIQIVTKEDNPGIDIFVKPGTKNESVHIPVILTQEGLKDMVYNDFYIGEGADVLIVAGCGIDNCGPQDSQHDGIHTFHIGKNAHVRYVEKHYGQGKGTGERILNPETNIVMEEGSYAEMEMVQIRGVNSTVRTTKATVGANAHLVIEERMLTHGDQFAETRMDIEILGEDGSAQVISRSVAQDTSKQIFYPRVVGKNRCKAHVQCDAIIMGQAQVRAIPEIDAQHSDAALVHEAAIGKIAGEQIIKLMTLGLDENEAEETILQGFLK